MNRFLGNLAVLTTVGVVALGTAAYAGDDGATAPSSTAVPSAPASTHCDEGHWPVTVQGQPWSFEAGARAGYYIWHDRYGWHLRTTTPSAEHHSFSGTVASTGNMKVVHEFRNEANDSIKVVGNVILFRFDTHDHV